MATPLPPRPRKPRPRSHREHQPCRANHGSSGLPKDSSSGFSRAVDRAEPPPMENKTHRTPVNRRERLLHFEMRCHSVAARPSVEGARTRCYWRAVSPPGNLPESRGSYRDKPGGETALQWRLRIHDFESRLLEESPSLSIAWKDVFRTKVRNRTFKRLL